MPELIAGGLHYIIVSLELAAAGLLILGFVIATVKWCRQLFGGDDRGAALKDYRRALGRVIIVGLEVLVAATVIKTITIEPSSESMGMLVFLVAIRTATGWATSLEMNGRWPWQKP